MHLQEDSKTDWTQAASLKTHADSAVTADSNTMTSHSLTQTYRASGSNQIGDIVGNRYVLQTRVGAGRLGIVYEAIDQQLTQASHSDYRVTIELFRLPGEQSHLRTRFASEFVDLLSVSHANIARIIDFGIDGATIFFTTELLEGTSLDSMLDSNSADSFSEKEILAVLRSVADALRYAHAKGFVHGGLSSESVFITTDYEVKIADLSSEVLKRTLGNPDEQLTARTQQALKPTADVFGVASVAYELLANEAPYEGLPRGHARKRGLRLRRIKGIPRYRWKALACALQLRATDRTPTIAQFIADFGINGTESLRAAEADDNPKKRRMQVPAVLLVAIATMAALVQFNVLNTGDIFAEFRERIDNSVAPIVAKLGGAKETVAPANIDTVVDSPTGDRMNEALPEPAQDMPLETVPGEEIAVASLVPGVAIPSSADLTEQELAPLADSQTPEEAIVVRKESVEDVAESVEDVAESVAAVATRQIDSALNAPPSIAFAREAVTVREGQDMASVVIQRHGNVDSEIPIFWWTGDNTAIADLDYAELGVRTETFAAGGESMSLYVPLISDSLAEQRESFYVFVASDLGPETVSDRLEVFVDDDDR